MKIKILFSKLLCLIAGHEVGNPCPRCKASFGVPKMENPPAPPAKPDYSKMTYRELTERYRAHMEEREAIMPFLLQVSQALKEHRV